MIYKIIKKEINWKFFFLHLLVAFIIYSSLYLRTFILKLGHFNIIYFVLKVFKYRLQHNTASLFGSSLLMYLTGYFKTWWGAGDFVRTNIWSVLWPVSLVISIFSVFKSRFLRRMRIENLITAIPFLYLIYLGVQAPFPRYFLIILPFAYLGLASFISGRLTKLKQQNVDRNPEKKS